ncbi:MAG: Snf7 family protein [Candidatus Heimdallarchaeota archaeon]|nr:MAG: Snf7 family protein [Candidatus Heimdallarchaeota archaeon]
MVFDKFGNWLRGGGGRGDARSTRKWIVRLRMVEKRMTRQRNKLIKEEKRMLKEVERAIEDGDMTTARLLAKDVAKNRTMARGCQQMASRVKAIKFKLEQAAATQAIGQDLKGLVKTLHQMNTQLKIPQLEGVLQQMEIETERVDMATEAMDEGFEMMTSDIEEDEMVDKIIGELSASKAAAADFGLPSPDIRSQELQKELEKIKKG